MGGSPEPPSSLRIDCSGQFLADIPSHPSRADMSAVIGNLPWKRALLVIALLALRFQSPCRAAADEKSGKAEAKSDHKAEPFPVAAYVDGDPLFVAEIDTVLFELQKTRQ